MQCSCREESKHVSRRPITSSSSSRAAAASLWRRQAAAAPSFSRHLAAAGRLSPCPCWVEAGPSWSAAVSSSRHRAAAGPCCRRPAAEASSCPRLRSHQTHQSAEPVEKGLSVDGCESTWERRPFLRILCASKRRPETHSTDASTRGAQRQRRKRRCALGALLLLAH